MSVRPNPFRLHPLRVLALGVMLCGVAGQAGAYVVAIGNAPKGVFLRVGDGGAATYNSGPNNTPGTSSTVNTVSATVAGTVLGNGVAQPMTSDAAQLTSSLDGYAFCDAGEVYVGGFVRGGTTSGTLTANAPASLSDGAGNTIPISQISWTSTGNGDTGAQPIPAGTFSGGTQTLASFAQNTWRESCHSFSYANNTVVSAGTYTARVTYTLSAP